MDDNIELILNDLKTICQMIGLQSSLTLDTHFQLPALKSTDGRIFRGLISICNHINLSPQTAETFPDFKSNDLLSDYEKLLTAQWLEYRMTKVNRICNERDLLQDLQCHLKDHVYLISNRCTLTDLVLYLAVRPLLQRVPLLEREEYTHVGRWFKQIGSQLSTRNSAFSATNGNDVELVFSKTPLRAGSLH